MDHHFNIEVAASHGVNVAIFMNNLAYWLMSNKAKNSTKHFHENRYWSYNTIESFVALFPYWSVKNIRTIIKNAKEADLIMIGHFSKRKSDRTQWFTFSDYGLSFYPSINSMQVVPKGSIKETFHLPKPANEAQCGLRGYENPPARAVEHLPKPAKPFAQTGTALPYINTDNRQKIKDKRYCPSDDELKSFEQFWSFYPRRQKRKDALKAWLKNKLTNKTDEILMHLMKRMETEWKGKAKNFIPLPTTFLNGEGWHDEIITNQKIIPITTNVSQHNRNVNYVMEKLFNGK